MTYNEAVNVHGLYGKEIWNAAINEAAKLINKETFFDDEMSADYLASKIKELKEGDA